MDRTHLDLHTALEQGCAWSALDLRLQRAAEVLGVTSAASWQRLVLQYHAQHHVAWSPVWPTDFHRDLLRYLRSQLETYPYYLAWQIRALDFPDPFDYYIELLCDALRLSKPYTEFPPFTALDIQQVVGLTSQEYSDTLSQCRAKGAAGRISKLIRTLLPVKGKGCEVYGWWQVFPLGRGTVRGTATEAELRTLQDICDMSHKNTPAFARNWPKSHLQGLSSLGVIIFHIPVSNPDLQFSPPIQTFPNYHPGSGFNQVLYSVLQTLTTCHTYDEVISQEEQTPVALIEDALEVICRLGLTEVREKEGTEEIRAVIRVGLGVVKGVEEGEVMPAAQVIDQFSSEPHSLTTLLMTLSQDMSVSVCVSNGVSSRAQVSLYRGNEEFNTEIKVRESHWQVYKLRKMGGVAGWFAMGRVVNALPCDLNTSDYYWLLMGDETPILLEHWEVLSTLQEALPYQELILIPYEERQVCPKAGNEGSQVLVIPLPLDLRDCGNDDLRKFLEELGGKDRLDQCIGYLELAHTCCASNSPDPWSLSPCCPQSFTLLTHRSGLPLTSPALLTRILNNLKDSQYLQSIGLQNCAERQQVEIFEYQEKLCASGSPAKS